MRLLERFILTYCPFDDSRDRKCGQICNSNTERIKIKMLLVSRVKKIKNPLNFNCCLLSAHSQGLVIKIKPGFRVTPLPGTIPNFACQSRVPGTFILGKYSAPGDSAARWMLDLELLMIAERSITYWSPQHR